jgi:hypothetical protein
MGPVNIIKFRHDPAATLGRYWHILIDKKELTDLLEQAVPGPIPRHWSNKTKALVNIDEMKKSLDQSAELELLICANCAASGYRSCGDLGLKSFLVTQTDQFVEWKIESPGHDLPEQQKVFLTFKFHRPQYVSEVENIIRENEK